MRAILDNWIKKILSTITVIILLTMNYSVLAYEAGNKEMLKASTKYDLRDSIEIKLKDQMSTKSCWAFSTTTALETYMAKIKNVIVEYSPRHIEYATSRTFLDGTNDVVFNRELDSGAGVIAIAAYLTSGMGPVLEKDMPFISPNKKINLSEIKGKQVVSMLKEYIMFPEIYKEIADGQIKYSNHKQGNEYKEYEYSEVLEIRQNIKEHITKYGSVISGIIASPEYFSSDNKSYYCNNNEQSPNHAVSIIGWDDNYAVENFRADIRPSQPGAWLIQNSNGEVDSYFYISYEDVWIESNTLGFRNVDFVNYDKIYQHDFMGKNSEFSMSEEMTYVVNVFEKDETEEFLDAISFCTIPDEEYEVFINSTDGSPDINKFEKIKSIPKTDSSYITIDLNSPIKLSNDKFAVMVKYINHNGNVSIPLESQDQENKKYIYCTSNAGESFIYKNGNFIDMKTIGTMNGCIKAFTKLSANENQTKLISSKYTISSNNMIKGVLPESSLGEFHRNILNNKKYSIINSKSEEVTNNDGTITTGMSLITETNEKYTIIVKGDTNGDGKATGTDLIRIKKHVVEIEDLKGNEFTAGDINNDGTVTSTDALNITQYLCDIITW